MYPRFFKRPDKGGMWYIEFSRGDRKSLGTRNDKTAKAMFEKIKAELLRGNLIELEALERISLEDFKTAYMKERGVDHSPDTIKMIIPSLSSLWTS
jgi:hypothetical protein